MEGLSGEILQLVKKKMREQGAYDYDAYKEMIDETLEYFQEKGKLDDQDNSLFIKEELLDRWEEVERKLSR